MLNDFQLLTDPLVHWAEQTPDAGALVIGEHTLTYQQLFIKACAMANTLIERGVEQGDRVGLYLDKSAEAVVAVYGILLAGAAYVPLDASAPSVRTNILIRDCEIKVLVSSKAKRRQLAQLDFPMLGLQVVIGIDSEAIEAVIGLPWEKVWLASSTLPKREVKGQDLSYVIYTSGSTGLPKGIMHNHSSGMSYARWAAAEYGLSAVDNIGNHSPFHFDISIFDLFATAVAGASLVLIPEPVLKLPASYSQFLEETAVSVLFTVPFALIQLRTLGVLSKRDLSRLRWVIFGGEPFPPVQLKALMRALPEARFDNMYGPAEVNGCTHHTLANIEFEGNVPIGRPAAIARIRIVSEDDALVAKGEPGELLVQTPTQMLGYWNRPDLTKRSRWFDVDTARANACYYRTGDLVRERKDGELEFMGRRDRQIKLRGYRIELDEIELVLNSNSAVEEATAYIQIRAAGEKFIEAQVRLSQSANAAEAETTLLAYARTQLPWYAVPQSVMPVAEFPRTTSGKIDRLRVQQLAQAMIDKAHQEVETHG